MTSLRSIHPGMVLAIRSALYDIRNGHTVTIDYGIRGTTSERPWGVVAPARKERP